MGFGTFEEMDLRMRIKAEMEAMAEDERAEMDAIAEGIEALRERVLTNVEKVRLKGLKRSAEACGMREEAANAQEILDSLKQKF